MYKQVWMVGTALVFIFCIGGTAYNMIHGVPNFKMAQDKETGAVYVEEYFQRNLRGQWAGEGYLAALLMLITGVSFVLLYYIGALGKTTSQRILIGTALILFTMFMTWSVNQAFTLKGFGGAGFFPPAHYVTGPITADQGMTQLHSNL